MVLNFYNKLQKLSGSSIRIQQTDTTVDCQKDNQTVKLISYTVSYKRIDLEYYEQSCFEHVCGRHGHVFLLALYLGVQLLGRRASVCPTVVHIVIQLS